MKKGAGVVPSKPKSVAGVILSKLTYDIHIPKRHRRTVLGGDKENILTVHWIIMTDASSKNRYLRSMQELGDYMKRTLQYLTVY